MPSSSQLATAMDGLPVEQRLDDLVAILAQRGSVEADDGAGQGLAGLVGEGSLGVNAVDGGSGRVHQPMTVSSSWEARASWSMSR